MPACLSAHRDFLQLQLLVAVAAQLRTCDMYIHTQETGLCFREAHEHITVPHEFVYVYDLPEKFNKDVKELPTIWHPEQYDIDQVTAGSVLL